MPKHSKNGVATHSSKPSGQTAANSHGEANLGARYDNCYPINGSTMVDYESAEAVAPTRFQKMAGVLESLERDMAYFVCQWGVGVDVGEW